MTFQPSEFLTLIDASLLKEYFVQKKIGLAIPEIITLQDAEKFWNEKIKSLPEPNPLEISGDFSRIYDMASDDGRDSIRKQVGIEFCNDEKAQEQFYREWKKYNNSFSESMSAFLKYREIFENAFIWDHELREWGSEYKLDEGLKEEFFTPEKIEALEEQFRKYFSKRKESGEAFEIQLHREKEFYCLSVYFEDTIKTDLGFKKGKVSNVPSTRAKRLHFFIFPKEQKITIKMGRTRPKKRGEIMKIFVEEVLGKTYDTDKFRSVQLGALLHEDQPLTYTRDDGVDYICLKSLLLENPSQKQSVILQVGDSRSCDAMHRLKKERNILGTEEYSKWQVKQAKIRIQFAVPERRGRGGSVTTTITFPHSCDLDEHKNFHKKAKSLLKRWGLLV